MLASFRQSCLEFEVSNGCNDCNMRVRVACRRSSAQRARFLPTRQEAAPHPMWRDACLVQVSTAENSFEEFSSKAKKFRDELKASVASQLQIPAHRPLLEGVRAGTLQGLPESDAAA